MYVTLTLKMFVRLEYLVLFHESCQFTYPSCRSSRTKMKIRRHRHTETDTQRHSQTDRQTDTQMDPKMDYGKKMILIFLGTAFFLHSRKQNVKIVQSQAYQFVQSRAYPFVNYLPETLRCSILRRLGFILQRHKKLMSAFRTLKIRTGCGMLLLNSSMFCKLQTIGMMADLVWNNCGFLFVFVSCYKFVWSGLVCVCAYMCVCVCVCVCYNICEKDIVVNSLVSLV